MDCPNCQSTARPARDVRELEYGLSPFRDWREADVFERIFVVLSEEPDMEYAVAGATIVKVHQRGQGAKGGLRARPSAAPKAA